MGWALLLDVAVSGAEGQADEEGSEITQEEVFLFWVVVYCFELDVIVYFVCYFVVVVLGMQLLSL